MFSSYDTSRIGSALSDLLPKLGRLIEQKTAESQAQTDLFEARLTEQRYRNDNLRGYRDYVTQTNQ